MPTKSGNEIKSEFLGVPYGTACSKLRKRLLFSLARKLGEAFCYRCGKPIESVEEFSVDHKKEWLYEDPQLFWDLENISFSHLSCNVRANRKPHKKEGPLGTAWCYSCKDFLSETDFYRASGPNKRYKKLKSACKKCENSVRMDRRRKRNGL